MRDDFSLEVKRHLAARVGHLCSNPTCRALTAGPQDHPERSVNLGVAAHISGAAPGGPRYNPVITPAERSHIDNGIWLCQNCAKLIDSDLARFSEALLRGWRVVAEEFARDSLGKTATALIAGSGETTSPLELILELEGFHGDTYSPRTVPIRRFAIGLKNTGNATVKFPSLSYPRSSGLFVDQFGIDGNGGYGLSMVPGKAERITFNGGFNDVIRCGQTLMITKLYQQGENMGTQGISVQTHPRLFGPHGPTHSRWVFKSIEFGCEIAGEAIPTITLHKSIPPDSVDWRRE